MKKLVLLILFLLFMINGIYFVCSYEPGSCLYEDRGGVMIGGTCYTCGIPDGVCPEDYNVNCDDYPDCDCDDSCGDVPEGCDMVDCETQIPSSKICRSSCPLPSAEGDVICYCDFNEVLDMCVLSMTNCNLGSPCENWVQISITACIDGFRTITYDDPDNLGKCIETSDVRCLKSSELPFFGFYNFIICFLLIALIYFVFEIRGRK